MTGTRTARMGATRAPTCAAPPRARLTPSSSATPPGSAFLLAGSVMGTWTVGREMPVMSMQVQIVLGMASHLSNA